METEVKDVFMSEMWMIFVLIFFFHVFVIIIIILVNEITGIFYRMT